MTFPFLPASRLAVYLRDSGGERQELNSQSII